MTGAEGKMKKVAMIAAASLFTVGAVVAAVVTGVIPHVSSTAQPVESVAKQPVQTESTTAVHKRVATRTQTASRRVASVAPTPPPCTHCGVIESIESFAEKGKASGGGAVAGGLLGGILGHQIGQGRGRELATVAGLVGGALAGNTIEKNTHQTMRYHVGVRMNDGTREVLTLNSAPNVAVGERVKIVNGEPVRD
ncbi:MAG: glycine zipper 2TM domain-containing protein [Sulfuricaulis sp.]